MTKSDKYLKVKELIARHENRRADAAAKNHAKRFCRISNQSASEVAHFYFGEIHGFIEDVVFQRLVVHG